uniref:Astacin domain-containing protein n=1 Tax=Brugia timori TaxID=42155 RepID=A0A0R3QC69_9BILA
LVAKGVENDFCDNNSFNIIINSNIIIINNNNN